MSVRARFVTLVLEQAGADLMTRQGHALSSAINSRSGYLERSRRIDVASGEEMDGRLTFTHAVYERFLDMRRPGGVKRKRRRIHNRFVFGTYSSIASRLMYGLTEEVVASLRG